MLNLLDTEQYYALTQKTKPKSPEEVIRQFTMLGCLKDDFEGGHDITNLGALLFARDLNNFSSVAKKSVRVIKYAGKDKAKSEREIEGRKGYAIGFAGLIAFIRNQIPTEEAYVDGVRQINPVFPLVAIREVIANALIHQDFTVRRSTGGRDLPRPDRSHQPGQFPD